MDTFPTPGVARGYARFALSALKRSVLHEMKPSGITHFTRSQGPPWECILFRITNNRLTVLGNVSRMASSYIKTASWPRRKRSHGPAWECIPYARPTTAYGVCGVPRKYPQDKVEPGMTV